MTDSGTSTRWSKRLRVWWPFLVVLVAFIAFLAVEVGSDHGGDGVGVATTVAAITTSANAVGGSGPIFVCTGDEGTGQPTVREAQLPSQARQTVDLISANGPFPPGDGSVFPNAKGALPDESAGYYHEYAIAKDGSDDGGAQRIVAGSCGDVYYTDDDGGSFRLVVVDG